ncbi:MAG: hypothetical protein J6W82_02720 [Bacteroidales bacterium]|nr:hypothetical protein [Bacteroidales bacterium]
MKLPTKFQTYAPPKVTVAFLTAERHFCQSGNLPNAWQGEDLFEEDFN